MYRSESQGSQPQNDSPRDGGGYWAGRQTADSGELLAPLLRQLESYDRLRLKLEKEGSTLADVRAATELLNGKIRLQGQRSLTEVALADAAGLRRALDDIGGFDLCLDVRRLDTGMPIYYLCRTRHDWYGECDLVVDDLYLSPGYPFLDDRFARLMRWAGHESCFLRLSPFRAAVAAMRSGYPTHESWSAHSTSAVSGDAIDRVLVDAARHIFAAAWHEDQTLGVMVARHFNLPQFSLAIEVLYLALSGDLCELRAMAHQEWVFEFLRTVYPQPAIAALLGRLPSVEGASLNRIPKEALVLYTRLSKAFGRFIEVPVTAGHRSVHLPLYKLVFANPLRLRRVGESLRATTPVRQAAERLERESQHVIECLVGPTPVTARTFYDVRWSSW